MLRCRYGILILLLLIIKVGAAQKVHVIKGLLLNPENEGIGYATVLLLKKSDSSLLQAIASDSLGYFHFNLPEPCYIKVSHVQYEDTVLVISHIITGDTILQVLLRKKTINSLKEAAITARRPLIEKKVDRLVFNVENSSAAAGGSVLEVLSKVPGVRVDNQGIGLIGKTNVRIMLNDRPVQLSGEDLLNFLRSISAGNIAKVEVITNPPAKYDAEGNGGLINLVEKKYNKEGYGGNAGLEYTQATYSTAAANVLFNYNKNNLKVFGSVNGETGSTGPMEQLTFFYPAQIWQQTDSRRDYRKYLTGKMGVDLKLNSKTLLSFSGMKSLSHPDMKEHVQTNVYRSITKEIDSTITTQAFTNRSGHIADGNIHFKYAPDTSGRNIVIDGGYFSYTDNNTRQFTAATYPAEGNIPSSYDRYLSANNQDINVYTLTTDINIPGKKVNFSTGAKLSFIGSSNDLGFYKWIDDQFKTDSSQTNQFKYTENTQSLYINLNRKAGRFEWQGGLRGEYTQTKGVSVITEQTTLRNYIKLYPAIYVTYKSDAGDLFALNYGKRIVRPGYGRLNPFRLYLTPHSYFEGNPFLQPSYTNSVELSYTHNNFFTTSVSYSRETNGFNPVTFVKEGSNIQATRPINFLTTNYYQVNNSVSVKLFRCYESNNQLQVFYTTSHSGITETSPSSKGLGAYVSSFNRFTINKPQTFSVEVNCWYQFPYLDGIEKSNAFYNVDVGMKLKLPRNFSMIINASDIFRTNTPVYNSAINKINQQYANYWDKRSFRIRLEYNWGNAQWKGPKFKSSNEEERKRTN